MKNNTIFILLCLTAVALQINSSNAVQLMGDGSIASKANSLKASETQPTPMTSEENAADGSTIAIDPQPNPNDSTTAIPKTTVPTTAPSTKTTPTTTITPTTTTPTTPIPANTTNSTTPTPTTIAPSNTTNATTISPTTPTTIAPSNTTNATTISPTTQSTIPTSQATTAAPSTSDRRFDGPSFIGGIVLSFGIMAIGFVAWKFYKARTERNYHTL